MSLFEIGRLVIKLCGRDAGKIAVVVDQLEEPYVLIDGQTRRRKCNFKHLEPLPRLIKIKKGASSEEVKAEFKKLSLSFKETKPKKPLPRPRKQRKKKSKEKISPEVKKETIKEKTKEKKENKLNKVKESSTSFDEIIEKEFPHSSATKKENK